MPSSVLLPIELSADERARLVSWMRRRTSAQALALRSRIVLLADEGLSNVEIARRLGVTTRGARECCAAFSRTDWMV